MENITIESFKREHLDGVVNIENTCFASPWSMSDLAAQLDNPTSHFYVALDGDTVAGYMGLQIFSGEGYVTNVAVLPEYRRQGIAGKLLERAMENGMNFITLEVRESNSPAIKLYEKTGFERVGIRPNFYSNPDENAIIMTKLYNQ